jgi:hypothetical protein
MIIKSIPLIFSGLLLTLYMKIDQFIIKGLLGNISLGHFSLVIRITEASVIIPYAILQVFSPKIFVNENNLEESQKYFDLSIIVAFTIAVTSTIFSRFIIITLFGIEYEPSILPFRICIWSILFLTFGQINYYLTISQNSQVVLLVKIFIGIIFNLTSCYILTSKYGIIGAAISTTLSYFFSAVFLVLFFKNQKWQFFAFLKSLFIPFTIIRLIKNSQSLKTI